MSESATLALEAIDKRVQELKDVPMGPGCQERLNEACVAGDAIRQGDLYVIVSEPSAIEGMVLVHDGVAYNKMSSSEKSIHQEKASRHLKLVPGTEEGSHHMLDSLDGVSIYYPKDFDIEDGDYAETAGPVFVCHREKTLVHRPNAGQSEEAVSVRPHGSVVIAAGHTISCLYQQNYSVMAKAAQRARD